MQPFPCFWRTQPPARREAGQSVVLFVLLLFVLLGFAALAIDGSHAYLQQQRAQVAADAAALAGVRTVALRGSDADVTVTVNHYISSNGGATATWAYTPNRRGIRVVATQTYPTFFGTVIGHPNMTVSATSEAIFRPLNSASHLLPMTIDCFTEYQIGTVYRIFATEDTGGPGGFGWLNWSGASNNNGTLIDSINNPVNSSTWSIGDLIPSGPGIVNDISVRNAFEQWVGKPVTIPLWDQITGGGASMRYRICAFAQFEMTGVSFTGNPKYIEGRFVRYTRLGTASDDNAPDHGVYMFLLTR